MLVIYADLEKKYGETTEKYRELQTRYFEKSEQWVSTIYFMYLYDLHPLPHCNK